MAGFLSVNGAQARGRTRNDQMTDKTAIQRIKELDQERSALFEQAKEEALRRAHQAVEDLNALGLKYRLVEGEPSAGSKGADAKLILPGFASALAIKSGMIF